MTHGTWQPINTAPEGEHILVCNPAMGLQCVIAERTPLGNWITDAGDRFCALEHPTLWMPCPDVPAAVGESPRKEESK